MIDPLCLGIILTIGPYLLPQVLLKLRVEYPELRISLHEQQTKSLLDSPDTGNLDVALIATPYDLNGLIVFNLRNETSLFSLAQRDIELQTQMEK